MTATLAPTVIAPAAYSPALRSARPAPDDACDADVEDAAAGGRDRTPVPDGYDEARSLELFRVATCQRDEEACELIMARHRYQVLAWIRRHPGAAALRGEVDDDDLVARTFMRFWGAVGAARFRTFRDLRAVLTYLKLCAASVVLDELRQQAGAARLVSRDRLAAMAGSTFDLPDAAADVEPKVLIAFDRAELWATVARVLTDGAQRQAVYLRFGLGLSAQEIRRRCPALFPEVEDVYRETRNALQRLRRSPALRPFRGRSGRR